MILLAVRLPSRAASLASIRRDSASTMNDSTNRVRPSVIGADRCVGSDASLNSLASADAIELPGSKSCAEMLAGVADHGVTAIVSRRTARAKHDAADDACLCVGQHHVPDHFRSWRRVRRPIPFGIGGVVSKTSRITDAMNGITITANQPGGEHARSPSVCLITRPPAAVAERVDHQWLQCFGKQRRETNRPHMP